MAFEREKESTLTFDMVITFFSDAAIMRAKQEAALAKKAEEAAAAAQKK